MSLQSARILEYFDRCSDPREHRIRHRLVDILVIVVLGTLCGEEGWEGYFDWARDKLVYLKGFLELKHGIPCPDTIRRVMERIDAEEFLRSFLSWAGELRERSSGQICIDGKRLRKAASPLHIVSAWCESNRMVLGAIHTERKGKEIPAIEELLDVLVLRQGDVVTIDAIGCQKSIVSRIVGLGADYLIALKGNQGNLSDEVVNYFDQAVGEPESGCDGSDQVWVCQDLSWLPQATEWPGLRSIVMVERDWLENGQPRHERRYYISSLSGTPLELGHIVRRHWSIENEFHWHLDVTLREDESHLSAAANKNLRTVRSLCLNLLRSEQSFGRGLKAKMRRCHRSESYLDQVLQAGNF